MKRRAVLIGLLALVVSAGCSRAPSARYGNPLGFSTADAEKIEFAARRVLAELRFEVEVPEASEGRLATGWLTGASWFEFWRRDTRGTYQTAESSLNTIRRRATITISPKEAGSEVFVKVDKQRRSIPDAAPESISHAFSLYNPEDSDLVRQNELAPEALTWVDAGRDDVLEQYILERIQAYLPVPK